MEVIHNLRNTVRRTGIETSAGLCEAKENLLQGKAAVPECMKNSKWHARLGHCNNRILRVSIPHIDGVKEHDKGHLIGNCKANALAKLTLKMQRSRKSDIIAFRPIE